MTLTRRQVLQAGVIGGTAALGAAPAGQSFTEPPPGQDELGVIDATGEGAIALEVVNATHQFHSTLPPSAVLAYRRPGGHQT